MWLFRGEIEVGGFHGSGLMYLLICSKIYVAKSCSGGLRLREGLVLFVEYLFIPNRVCLVL